MRTTLDIDTPILNELKRRAEAEGLSLGEMATRLLAKQLHEKAAKPRKLNWAVHDMGPFSIDISDKEALNAFLDKDDE